MLHVGSVCTPGCILLDVVVFCCAKFETCQTFSTLQTGATLLANKSHVVGCYMLRPFAHPVAFCWFLLRVVGQSLKPVKLLALCKRAQRCWMLHVASVCTPCCILLDVVACCWAKFETGQTFSTMQTGALLLTNQSQHCCANNVGSCCVRISSGLQTDATTPNNVGTCSASWEGYNQ